ncbi:uncharacterized protein DI49_5516 [Saccharomyces eubayanus]|nr:hypothetical protein DI49_5516 [Saccharomyces eubayanus]KOG96362.1 hypothetical protein DI49_5516 [Saccharomyces eubayanus]
MTLNNVARPDLCVSSTPLRYATDTRRLLHQGGSTPPHQAYLAW